MGNLTTDTGALLAPSPVRHPVSHRRYRLPSGRRYRLPSGRRYRGYARIRSSNLFGQRSIRSYWCRQVAACLHGMAVTHAQQYVGVMYATCLFCHGALGRNESIEHFPVGRRLAFDAAKGRLWVVCPRCARWNLTPLDARWEAIEEAERAAPQGFGAHRARDCCPDCVRRPDRKRCGRCDGTERLADEHSVYDVQLAWSPSEATHCAKC